MEIPRWYSFLFLIIGMAFGFLWIKNTYASGNTLFLFVGILIVIAIVGTAIYQLITGKAPWKVKQSK